MASLKATKRALMLNVVSLLMSITMLIGTTYAWLSDSVSSGKNQIIAGNLDIELLHNSGSDSGTVTNNTELFQAVNWEPGDAIHEDFTVQNVGDMAIQYELALDVVTQNYIQYNSKYYSLADVLQVAVVPTQTTAPSDYLALAKEQEKDGKTNPTLSQLNDTLVTGQLDAAAAVSETEVTPSPAPVSQTSFTVILYWDDTAAHNEFNNAKTYTKSGETYTEETGTGEAVKRPVIKLGITFKAGQLSQEADSFDAAYDTAAPLPTVTPFPTATPTP